jgi:hypothetical protein
MVEVDGACLVIMGNGCETEDANYKFPLLFEEFEMFEGRRRLIRGSNFRRVKHNAPTLSRRSDYAAGGVSGYKSQLQNLVHHSLNQFKQFAPAPLHAMREEL